MTVMGVTSVGGQMARMESAVAATTIGSTDEWTLDILSFCLIHAYFAFL